jgi:general secretion pathway protein J
MVASCIVHNMDAFCRISLRGGERLLRFARYDSESRRIWKKTDRLSCALSHLLCRRGRASGVADSAGFTLLELIIALTILTLVTVIIGSGLRISVRAWDKGEAETGETQRLRILSGMLSQQIKSAYPYKVVMDNEEVILFEGEKNSILFATALADETDGGMKWVRYEYRGGSLYYNEGILPDKKLDESIASGGDVLDADTGEITFEYLDGEGEWKDSWDRGDGLPVAVRVKISYFQPFQVYTQYGTRIREDEGQS